ncbi:MAG: response regulator [Dehalococcoidia bacterium]
MKKVLIVDDNLEERKIFSTYFQFVGGHVVEAPDGQEGLKAARDHQPDLIIMDLSMPVMDGWEALRRLQSDADLRRIPVIAVTAHHLPRSELEQAGFRGYLEKPLAPYRVLNEVERCLGPIHGLAVENPEPVRTRTFETPLREKSSLQHWLGSAGR